MKVFNTMSRTLEDVVPLEAGHIRLYTCGPTVYDFAHIGNFRAYVFEDLLRRQIKAEGFRVTQVMNITDIDDKTIRGSQAEGLALKAYTERYVQAFFDDLKVLRIEPAEHYPAATDHIPAMIDLIERIIQAGYAYPADDGSVYFNVGRFENYGKLAHLDVSGLRAGARVEQDEYDKDNLADFALWKGWTEDDGDVAWASPWGRGRPGWHIECSAMSSTYLGESFDMHTGGVDNMFPHHENEIAQSEAASGKPFVRYWMHCEHLQVDGQKMSKSLGNFFTLRDILDKGYSGREVRYVLLAGHYRQTLNFTFKALDAARTSLARVDEFRRRLTGHAGTQAEVPAWATHASTEFKAAVSEDLGMPEALAALFGMIHDGNRALDAGDVTPAQARGALDTLDEMDQILGVFGAEEDEVPAIVYEKIAARQKARAAKDYALADQYRDEIDALGYTVKDTADGPVPKRKL